MMEANHGTGAGLRDFLDWASSKGELNPATANSLKAAASAVLSVEDNPDTVDITKLDVDTILRRFGTLHKARYKPDSMRTYQSRFRTAVTMYLAWLADDPNWRKVVRARRAGDGNGRSGKPGGTGGLGLARVDLAGTATVHVSDADAATARQDAAVLVSYKLPLRPDLIVQLTLPVDLTQADADRVSAFVRSLAFGAPGVPEQENARPASETRKPETDQ